MNTTESKILVGICGVSFSIVMTIFILHGAVIYEEPVACQDETKQCGEAYDPEFFAPEERP